MGAEDDARDYLRLVAPLVPPGRLAVLLSGTPRRSAHLATRDAIVAHAARHRAHRQSGVAVLRVHFGRGVPAGGDGCSVALVVDVDDAAHAVRFRRLAVLLVVLCTLLLLNRRVGRGLAVLGEDVGR